ncbi:hypothetical protein VTO73DRAFT_13323 [Trametes versicolor]
MKFQWDVLRTAFLTRTLSGAIYVVLNSYRSAEVPMTQSRSACYGTVSAIRIENDVDPAALVRDAEAKASVL